MEIVPQPNFCPIEPENNKSQAKKPVKNSSSNTDNQPMGVVPPELPNQTEASAKAGKSTKTSPWLFILVMLLLTISSGLGYLIVSGQTNLLPQLLSIN